MTAATDQRRGRRRGPSPLDPHSSTFHAFADMLYAGVLIFLFALPVVTWFAAFSAGVEAIREARSADAHVRVRAVWSAFVDRVVRHPISHVLAPTAVTAVLVVDVVLLPYVAAGELWSSVLPIVLASGLGAIALRIAGTWRRDQAPRALLARAWQRMSTDAAGSALLVLAVVCAGAIVVIAPLLALVLPGGLALAALAMDRDEGIRL